MEGIGLDVAREDMELHPPGLDHAVKMVVYRVAHPNRVGTDLHLAGKAPDCDSTVQPPRSCSWRSGKSSLSSPSCPSADPMEHAGHAVQPTARPSSAALASSSTSGVGSRLVESSSPALSAACEDGVAHCSRASVGNMSLSSDTPRGGGSDSKDSARVVVDTNPPAPRGPCPPVTSRSSVTPSASSLPRLASFLSTCSSLSVDTEYSDIVEELGTSLWAYVWGTAPFFSEVLLAIGLESQSVLELGCGCTVAGVAAALAGATSVVCTDYNPRGFEFGRLTAEANDVGDSVSFRRFNWENPPEPADVGAYSMVIGSDVLYLPSSAPHILSSIKALLRQGGTALIADPGRAAADIFIESAQADPDVAVYCHRADFVASTSVSLRQLRVIEVMLLSRDGCARDSDGVAPKTPADYDSPVHKSVTRVFDLLAVARRNPDSAEFHVTAFRSPRTATPSSVAPVNPESDEGRPGGPEEDFRAVHPKVEGDFAGPGSL